MPSLKAFDADVADALEHINVPSYVIDTSGVVRWVNSAARRLVGDVTGRQFTSVVAPEETRRAREIFARRLLGRDHGADSSVVLVDGDGARISVELSAVPLTRGDQLIPGRISHGCVRLRNEDIVRLSRLMPVGTPVTIR